MTVVHEDNIDFGPPTPLHPNPAWLIDGADLLAEPDPGPTPWLVEDLIVEGAIVAAVGRWKTTKSYGLLDLCISIATGEPAFGHLTIPTPGPVVFVNEESGRAALWRRLDSLCRGRAIDPERLRGRLLVAANARIKLDDQQWQHDLLELGQRIQPRLYVFDPLARMKAPGREENDQGDMAVLIEYVRLLRDETKAAVGFVHHTGHAGEHMRGSSDLESAWETRIRWKREGQSPLVTLEAEHREAEAPEPLSYRITWDTPTRSMLFKHAPKDGDTLPPLEQRIRDWLTDNPKSKARDVAKGIQVRAADVDRVLDELETAGRISKGRSGRVDKHNREIRDTVYSTLSTTDFGRGGSSQTLFQNTPGTSHGTTHNSSSHNPDEPGRVTNRTNTKPSKTQDTSPNVARPTTGTTQDDPHTEAPWLPGSSHPLRGDARDEPPDETPPHLYLAYLETINDTQPDESK